MTQRAAAFVLSPPLPGLLHPVNWSRPAGNHDFKESSTLAMHLADGRNPGTDWHNSTGDAQIGTPVYAMAAGEVRQRDVQHTPGQIGDGSLTVRIFDPKTDDNQGYAHLLSWNVVLGQWVKRFQQIGREGKSGAPRGAHLHCHHQKVVNGVKTHLEVWTLLDTNHAVQFNAAANGVNIRETPSATGKVIARRTLAGIISAGGVWMAHQDTLLGPRPKPAVTTSDGTRWEAKTLLGRPVWVARNFIHFV